MGNHCIFKFKDGTEKKLYITLAQDLEKDKKGKIVERLKSKRQIMTDLYNAKKAEKKVSNKAVKGLNNK